MAKAVATPEQIREAIHSMQLGGLKINLRTLHKYLGGGSFSSITPVLKQWRDEQQPVQQQIPELPDSFRGVMDKTIQSLWQATWQAMSDSESSELCALKDEMRQRDIDHELLESDYLNQQLAFEEVERALEVSSNLLAERQLELIELRCELTAEKEKLNAEQEKTQQITLLLKQQQDSRDVVLVGLATEKEKIASLLDKYHNLEQELVLERNERSVLVSENANLKEQIKLKDNELNEFTQSLSQADIRLAEVSGELIVCRENLDNHLNELTEKNEKLDGLNQKYQELQLRCAQQKKQLKETESIVVTEQQHAKELAAELRRMETALTVEQEANRISQSSIERMCNARIEEMARELQQLREQLQAKS